MATTPTKKPADDDEWESAPATAAKPATAPASSDDEWESAAAPAGNSDQAPPSDEDLSNFTPQMREKVKSGVAKMQPPTKFEQDNTIKKNYGFTPGNVLSNAYQGAKGLLGSVGTAAYDAALGEGKGEDGETAHGLGGLVGLDAKGNFNPMARVNDLTQKYITDPAVAQANKAKDEYEQGHTLGAVGHGLAAAVPLVGPAAADTGEQVGSGDVGGAVGQTLGQVAGGEALGHIGKISKAAGDVADKVVRGTPITDAGKLEAAKNQAMVVKKPSMNETEYSDKVTAALPDLQKAAQDNMGKVKTPRDAVGAINGRISQIEAPITDHLKQLGDIPENQVPTDMVNHSVMNAVDAELAKDPGKFTPAEVEKAKATVQKFLGDQPNKSLIELENNRRRFNQESQDYYSSKPADQRAMDASEATAVAQRAAGDAIRDLNYGPADGSAPGLLEKAGVTAQDSQGNPVQIRDVRKQVGNLIDVRNHFEDAITRAEAAGDHSLFGKAFTGPSLAAGGVGTIAGLAAGGPIGAVFGTLAGEGAKAWGDYLRSKNPNLNVEKMFRNLGKVEAQPNVSSVKTANPTHQFPHAIGPLNAQYKAPIGPNLPPAPFEMNAGTKPNASQMWQTQVGELPKAGFPERPPAAPAAPAALPRTLAPPAVPDQFRREAIGQPGAELPGPQTPVNANALGAEGLGGVRVPPGSRALPAPRVEAPATAPGGLGNVAEPTRGVIHQIGDTGLKLETGQDLGDGLGTEHVITEHGNRIASVTVDPQVSADGTLKVHWLGGELGQGNVRALLAELKKEYPDAQRVTYDRRRVAAGANAATTTAGKSMPIKSAMDMPDAVKSAIGDTDLEYRGTDKFGINHLHDPQTGNTLAVLDKDLDPAKVKARLESKRAEMQATSTAQKKTLK